MVVKGGIINIKFITVVINNVVKGVGCRVVGDGIIITMVLAIIGGIFDVVGGGGIVALVSGGLNTPLVGSGGTHSALVVTGLVVRGFQFTVRGLCFL